MPYSPNQQKKLTQIVEYLKAAGDYVESVRIEDCGKKNHIYYLPEEKTALITPQRCGSPFCPVCGRRKRHRLQAILSELITRFPDSALRFITITQKSYIGESLEHAGVRLRKNIAKLCRRKGWKDKVFGTYIRYEVEYNKVKKTWHYHAHIIAHGKYYDKDALKALWFSVTKDSYVTDIRQVKSTEPEHLSKYVTNLKNKGVIPLKFLSAHMRKHRMYSVTGSLKKIWRNIAPTPVAKGYMYISSVSDWFEHLSDNLYDNQDYAVALELITTRLPVLSGRPYDRMRCKQYLEKFKALYFTKSQPN